MKKTTLAKSLLTAAMFVLMATQAFGQISTGTPTHRTLPTGNRPVAGDWGLFIGPSVNEISDLIHTNSNLDTWYMIPLVNVKYYNTDNIEFRAGLQISSKTWKVSGTQMDPDYSSGKDEFEKQRDAYYRLTPGIAYHFAPTNILDVYVGAQLPFGLSTDKYTYQYDGKNYGTCKRTSFEIGLGAFIGLQCFIADLPVAIGLEYGFSGVKYFGQKYKNIITDSDGSEQTFYTTPQGDNAGGSQPYKSLRATKGYFGSDLRITLSYYFN